MNKWILVYGCIVVSFLSCKKTVDERTAHTIPQDEKQFSCATDRSMQLISSENKNFMMRNEAVSGFQAEELLLFLNFEGGRVVPGFIGTAQGGVIVSPIVSFPRICPPSNLSAENRELVVQFIKDDFSPFNIVITTDQQVYDAYNPSRRQSCVITTIPGVLGFSSGEAGVAPFIGTGFRLTFSSFVFGSLFGNDVRSIADVVSHEVGHTLGLAHQHLYNESCQRITEYHPGFGSGELSFGPIMGAGFKSVTNWFAQPCVLPVFNNVQNDFEMINDQVSLKNDDFPNDFGGRVAAPNGTTGVLEQDGDIDFLYIAPHSPSPLIITSNNIDLKATLYNPGGNILGEYNDPSSTGITIPEVRGVGYLKIEAAGNQNMPAKFMTGEYKISY